MRKLFIFTSWKLFGKGSLVLREQGTPIVINIYFGPLLNAAYTVANSLFNKVNVLSLAINRAFQPAVVAAEGKGDRQEMLSMAIRVCKFGTLLVMFLAIPAILEMDNLLNLWLVNPPEYAAAICKWLLALLLVNRVTGGHALAINAFGKIAAFEVMQGIILFSAVPLIAVLFTYGFEPNWVGTVFFVTTTIYCIGRVIFAKKLIDFPLLTWLKQAALPVSSLLILGSGVGGLSIYCLDESLMRILVTAFSVALAICAGAWPFLLGREEKIWIKFKIQKTRQKYFPSLCL